MDNEWNLTDHGANITINYRADGANVDTNYRERMVIHDDCVLIMREYLKWKGGMLSGNLVRSFTEERYPIHVLKHMLALAEKKKNESESAVTV